MTVFVLAAVAISAQPYSGTYGVNYTHEVARLRRDLLKDYDTRAPPTSNRSATGSDYTDAGTDVRMQIRFFKVESVVAAKGTMRLKVWLREYWDDFRLRWNPADYGGIDYITFYGDPAPTTWPQGEIWFPDVQPYNGLDGIVVTLEPALAKVTSDGTVFWSRPGMLDVMCKFSGLVKFPYDNLKCKIEFGGWAWSGAHQGIQLHDGGFAFSAQEATQGSSYQEYSIEKVGVDIVLYEYPCCPSESWPNLQYTITLSRASFFYTMVIIFPTILTTSLSFAVFWADSAAADALSYGVTVIVVSLLMQVVLIGMLPVCGELLWIDLFINVNAVFCCISLFQSCFTILIEYNTEAHLPVPGLQSVLYLMDLVSRFVSTHVKKRRAIVLANGTDSESRPESSFTESIAGVVYRQKGKTPKVQESAEERVSLRKSKLAEEDAPRKLIYYEKLFYKFGGDSTAEAVSIEDASRVLSFALLDVAPEERSDLLCGKGKDGQLSRLEFVEMCVDVLWLVPISQIELAIENLAGVLLHEQERYARYWKEVANDVDAWARVVIPGAYILTMVVLFSLDLSDDYDKPGNSGMFEGLGHAHIGAGGIVRIIAFVLVAAAGSFGWLMKRRLSAQEKKRKKGDRDAPQRMSSKGLSISASRTAPVTEASPED